MISKVKLHLVHVKDVGDESDSKVVFMLKRLINIHCTFLLNIFNSKVYVSNGTTKKISRYTKPSTCELKIIVSTGRNFKDIHFKGFLELKFYLDAKGRENCFLYFAPANEQKKN